VEQLTPAQRQAVCHREGPLLVLAGPGSGKTRVITYRIAALIESGVPPYHICAITFTNKAAEQMRQRAAALGASRGAHISTFHSLCVQILRRYAQAAGIGPNFSIYDEADQMRCVKEALRDCDIDASSLPPGRVLEAISTLKNKLIEPGAFKLQAEDFFSRTLAKVYARYQKILADRNGLDFDDLLMKAALLLENDATVSRALSDRFQYLLIDEYQDTNHAQYRLAKALTSYHNNICAVGDPDQSIYRWRGADVRNIMAFEKDWPNATIIKLEENFRSTPAILTAADKLIACNRHRKHKNLVPVRNHEGQVHVDCYEDEAEEADGVARGIQDLVDQGVSGRQIAVFYRVNAMSRALEEALIRRRIAYQVVRGVEFYNRKEIRDVLAYLKVLVNPADEVALQRIINTPTRGIGKVTVDKLSDHAARHGLTMFDTLRQVGEIPGLGGSVKAKLADFAGMMDGFVRQVEGKVAPVAERVFIETGLQESLRKAGPEGETALENVEELINTAAAYDERTDNPSLVDYLQQIALFSDADVYDAASGQVALMTLHAAKGLEFEHVFVVGLETGLLPHERANGSQEELEEERRLLFVGITRAKTSLHISYARYRTVRGQLLRTIPSQFLYELGADLIHQVPEPDEEPRQCRLAAAPRPEPARAAPSRPAPFAPGELVRHKTFGLGRVKRFVDMGANSVIQISFNSGQTKSLLLQYAELTKA
jgi:DNA helicase-2/ATP-dependent DNA helicase PcrA